MVLLKISFILYLVVNVKGAYHPIHRILSSKEVYVQFQYRYNKHSVESVSTLGFFNTLCPVYTYLFAVVYGRFTTKFICCSNILYQPSHLTAILDRYICALPNRSTLYLFTYPTVVSQWTTLSQFKFGKVHVERSKLMNYELLRDNKTITKL